MAKIARRSRRRRLARYKPYASAALQVAGAGLKRFVNGRVRSTKTRLRTSRSRTSTRTRTRTRRRGGAAAMDDAASSSFKHVARKRNRAMFKGWKKVLGARAVNSSMNTKISVSSQTQNFAEIRQFYNGVGHTLGLGSSTDLLAMVANLRFDEATTTSTNALSYLTRKFYVSRIKSVSHIRNMTTAPVNITLYDIVPRKDMTEDFIPSNMWIQGLANVEAAVANSVDIEATRPGVTPFMSPRLTKFFKIKKVKEFTLHAGSVHKHYVTLYPNKMWTVDEVTEVYYTAGLSVFTLVVVKGGVAHSVAAPSQVVYSNAIVDILTDYHAVGYVMERNPTVSTYYQLSYVAPDPLEQVVEDTDTVMPVDT